MRFPPAERLTSAEAANYLGFSTWTLANWRMRGFGPPYLRVGARKVAYRVGDLDDWIAANSERAAV